MAISDPSNLKDECFDSAEPSGLIKDAEKGDLQAMFELASLIREDAFSVKCLKIAYNWFEKAHQEGHLKSGIELARMLINGEGVEQEIQEGTKRLQQFIKLDMPEAHYYFAYFSFVGIFPRSLKIIQKHLKQAIRLGSEEAIELSEEVSQLQENNDYLEEKRFQKLKETMQQYPFMKVSYFQFITSVKSAQLLEDHVGKALQGDLNSIETIYDIYPIDHEAKSFWFNQYLTYSQHQLALNNNIKTDSQDLSLSKRPHALNLATSLYPKTQLRFSFPESIPLFIADHLQDQFDLIDQVKKLLKKNLTDHSNVVIHATIAKALVRKMLYHVSNIYNLSNQPLNDHPVGLLQLVLKMVIHLFYVNIGDFRTYNADQRYFETVISKGNTFDLIPSLLSSVKSFDELQKDAIYYSDDSFDLPLIYQYDEGHEQFLFESLDAWLSDDNHQKDGQGFLLAWVALHTIIFQVSWDESSSLSLKANRHQQFYLSIEMLVERFYGTFKLEELPLIIQNLWLNDLIQNYMYQNVLEQLFEDYDKRFETNFDEDTYYDDDDDWDDDWDDDDEESTEELSHDSKRYIGSK
jgi:hypothetical protein